MHTAAFLEAVRLGLWPIGGRSSGRSFHVSLSAGSEDGENLVAGALDRDDYRRDLAAAVCDFLGGCVVSMMALGEATYEIVYLREVEGGPAVGFWLAWIMPGTVRRRLGSLVQYVPRNIAAARGVPPRVSLDADRIVRFTLPAWLNGEVRRTLNCLLSLNRLAPDFALQFGSDGRGDTSFDHSVFFRRQNLALADAGRALGWNPTGLLQGEITDPYLICRFLRFERFKILIRETQLATLNDALKRVLGHTGIGGQVIVEGLPTAGEIKIAEADLAAGTVALRDILRRFSL